MGGSSGLRITGGQWRGRTLEVPAHGLRPTQSKLRQALFNTLQMQCPGARVLELFAGSGALGFEALSRGALSAVLVDSSAEAIRVIGKNAAALGCMDQVQAVRCDVARFTPKLADGGDFDLVLADPPYRSGWELRILDLALPWLAPGGYLVLESSVHDPALPEVLPHGRQVRSRSYGDTQLTHYERI